MALASNETVVQGVVVDNATGNIVTTTSTAGAVMSGGLLKDPDGRLVVMFQ